MPGIAQSGEISLLLVRPYESILIFTRYSEQNRNQGKARQSVELPNDTGVQNEAKVVKNLTNDVAPRNTISLRVTKMCMG